MSLASVRFSDSTLKSVVKDVNLTEVRVIAKRDQEFPGILDQAVVDIDMVARGNWQGPVRIWITEKKKTKGMRVKKMTSTTKMMGG